MKGIKRLLIMFTLVTFLLSCSSNEQNIKQKPILYASIYPLQFIVEQLTEDFAITKAVFPPGVDAHTYEPTLKDTLAIAQGQAFFFLGEQMEGSAERMKEALKNYEVSLIEIGQHTDLFLSHHKNHLHIHNDFDPHFWFDPKRMIFVSEIIKDELLVQFPKHKDLIKQNFSKLKTDLETLDERYMKRLQHKKNKKIIVSHAAYHYWEERYGIEQIPISGLSSTDEPSQKALAQLVELALEHDLQYVLFEQTTSNRLASIVQEEINAEALFLHDLETLLPEDLEKNRHYFSIMEDNLNVLDQATE